MSWIDEVIHATAESESPERYFYWSAVAAISAVVRRNVSLQRWYYRLYPNIFVLLVGPPSIRKGVPVNLARTLVEKIDCTRVFSGRGTIQGIIRELSRAYTFNDGSLFTDAQGFLCNGEFDAMLANADEEEYNILIDLYDTHFKNEWKNIIKGDSVKGVPEVLKNICLVLLGASNETNLSQALPKNIAGTGFVARTLVINEHKRKLLNSLVYEPKTVPDIEKLSERLEIISNINGEFVFSKEAGEYYNTWYNGFSVVEMRDPTGTMERVSDTILKVAMLLSLAEKDDLILDTRNIEDAIEKCLECVPGMKRVFLSQGEGQLAKPTAKVLKIMLDAPENTICRRKLLQRLYGEADAIDLDRIIDTLTQSGAITVTLKGMCKACRKEEMLYSMPKGISAQYNRFKKESVQ